MYTAVAEGKIYSHDQSKPLFLYLPYLAVHSANRPADPIQAPDEWIKKYDHIEHEERRKFAAVTGYMDYGIGRVRYQMIQTLIVLLILHLSTRVVQKTADVFRPRETK